MIGVIHFVTFLMFGLAQIAIQGIIILLLFRKEVRLGNIIPFTAAVGLAHQIPAAVLPNKLLFISLIIYFVTIFLAVHFIFKFNYLSSLLATGVIYLVTTIIEYTGMAILKVSFQSNFASSEWVQSFTGLVIMRGVGLTLCIIAAIIIYYINMKVHFPEDYIRKRMLNIIIAVLISIIIVIPNILYFINSVSKVATEYLIFNAVSLLVLLLFTRYSTVKFGELNIKSQQLEFQNLYIKSMSDTVDSLRGFKHDLTNIMQVFKGYLDLNDVAGAKKYFGQVFSELRVVNNSIPLNNHLKGSPEIYGLLLGKISYSEIKDVVFNINISTDITIKDMKILDFCKILGILLDNAFEASIECSKKIVELNIWKNEKENQLIVEISNTCSGDVDLDKIFLNGFTTKAAHTGFGLYEVKKIIGKYSYCSLKTYKNGDFFTQRLCI